MTALEQFADDVAAVYATLTESLRLGFEQVGSWAVEELYDPADHDGATLGAHPTTIAGIWCPAERLVILYRAPANGMVGTTLHQWLRTVLRHEIGHAIGMTHHDLAQLGLCDEHGEQSLDHCARA